MFYAPLDSIVGTPQIQMVTAVDTTQRTTTGELITAVDSYWGTGEFVYGYAAASIRQAGVCTIQVTSQTFGLRTEMTEVTNVAGLGRQLCVAMAAMTVGQFGWFAVTGSVPVNSTSSLAAATALGIVAAGQVGVLAAGKQVVNATASLPATTTVAKVGCTGISGQLQINIPNGEGWFLGVYLSGTGIGTGAVVTGITPDQKIATVSVANSAAVTGTVTATYNNATVFYNVVTLSRPFAQGQIV